MFLIFQFWRSGDADVTLDGVYIFTDSQPVQSPLTWLAPGGNYRGGGIWVRYTDGAGHFSSVEEADLTPAERLVVSPVALVFLAEVGMPSPPAQTLTIQQEGCEPFTWSVSDDAIWLETQPVEGDTVQVSVDIAGMAAGSYQATITIEAESSVQIPVELIVAKEIWRCYLPLTLRDYRP